MVATLPDSHRDLLADAVNVVLTTVMPDGQPQTTPVWCNLEGDLVLVNTMRSFRKFKNMHHNPMVTLLAYRLDQPLRNIEVRGLVVEMTEDGAVEHLNELNLLYTGKPSFFGDTATEAATSELIPVKVKIRPISARVEGE